MLKQEPWERVFFYQLGEKYDGLQQYQLAELFYQLGIYLFPELGLGNSLTEKLAALARVEYLLGKRQQSLEAYLLSLAYDASWRRRLISYYQGKENLAALPKQWRVSLVEQARSLGQMVLGPVEENLCVEEGLKLMQRYALLNAQERESSLLKFLYHHRNEVII